MVSPRDMHDGQQWLRHPRLREAARLADEGRGSAAVDLLRAHLKQHPRDACALHLFAGIARRQGRLGQALSLWQKALEAAPEFASARLAFAEALLDGNRAQNGLVQAQVLLDGDPQNADALGLKALALEALDDHAGAADIWRALIERQPENVRFLTRYAWVLRALGALDESIAVCRKVVSLQPGSGGAWWNLADIKTFRFDDADVAAMERSAERAAGAASDRACLHFALGKAYADRKNFAKSFEHYAKGNAVQRLAVEHDPDVLTSYVERAIKVFTPSLFERFAAWGSGSREPIFIIGMMRSGSTLVEQILASHSQIEGTRELPEIALISQELQHEFAQRKWGYPEGLERLEPEAVRSLSARYLANTGVHRKLGRPRFMDKMGANFAHVGLIQVLFPNAKIIDVRRYPLACGFSIFAQYFPKGQNNTWRLSDIGRNYRDYVSLMDHYDRVLPGGIHRVFYERLVAEPESEIRNLLDFLELPFEQPCLEFHRTRRTIATISAEQVRRPIYRSALDHWRHYEPWLGSLKAALGPSLEAYPVLPDSEGDAASGGGGSG